MTTSHPSADSLVARMLDVKPVYEIPDDNLVGEVLIPALQVSDQVDIAVGFFSSHCIAQIAPGLASLVDRNVQCRLLISPEISIEDRDAIDRGLSEPEAVIDAFMVELLTRPLDAIASHVVDCLSYLIAIGAIQLRCVLMDQGMFHKKLWIIRSHDVRLAVHGSGNLTARGLFVNGEQMTVDRPWMDGVSASTRVDDLARSFECDWSNKRSGRLCIEPHQMIALLRDRKRSTSVVPTTKDFWSAWQSDLDAGLAPELPPGMAHPPEAKRLQVPEWVDWHNPPYGHQAKAIAALDSCDFVGLVAMATGGGKTKTALISSCIVQDRSQRSLLVVIVVPTRVLADQWAQEVREFGVAPVLLSGSTSQERAKDLENIAVSLASDQPRTEVAICTLSLFASSTEIKNVAAQMSDSADTLLIADEVHNFGAPGFMNDPPEFFRYRIGLSATPVRQYDAEGTASLFEYFRSSSEPAFTFTLRDAIRAGCLTPYRYHLHPVELSDDEMDRYRELTQQLRQSGFGRDDGEDRGLTDRQERLLRERRALVEQADAKLGRLEDLLGPSAAELTHTLIYCSAKAVKPPHLNRQIELARDVLDRLRISTHMYTSVESARRESRMFLEGFASGEYQTLLAMKVLDEGVDVPAARQAFLLASSTVEREWVQRRGRILRNSPGKRFADLHDFIVIPPDLSDPDGRSLVRSELQRAEHFAADSENNYDDGGPRDVIKSIEDQL